MQKKICSVIILIVGIAGSIKLKIYGIISEPTLVIFILFTILSALFVAYSHVVKSINLSKGTLILKDIKETEASIKELAKAILAVTEASNHVLMLPGFDGDVQKNAIEKLRKLTR